MSHASGSGEARQGWLPGRQGGLGDRRRRWAAYLGISEAEVAWLPEGEGFTRALGRLAPGWKRLTDEEGSYLERVLRVKGAAEAMALCDFAALMADSFDFPSRLRTRFVPPGGLELQLRDEDVESVTLDDLWLARLLERAGAIRRRKRHPAWRLRRWLRRRAGRGPEPMSAERFAAELAKRPGWWEQQLAGGHAALVGAFAFRYRNPAQLFVHRAAASLAHLWEGLELEWMVEAEVVCLVLLAPRHGWPPPALLDAVDWLGDLAACLGGAVGQAEAAADEPPPS